MFVDLYSLVIGGYWIGNFGIFIVFLRMCVFLIKYFKRLNKRSFIYNFYLDIFNCSVDVFINKI